MGPTANVFGSPITDDLLRDALCTEGDVDSMNHDQLVTLWIKTQDKARARWETFLDRSVRGEVGDDELPND